MNGTECDTCYWKTHLEGKVRGCMFCSKYVEDKKKIESFSDLCKRIKKKYTKEPDKEELKEKLYNREETLSVERIPFDY